MWDGGLPFVWWEADEGWWDTGIPLGQGGFVPPSMVLSQTILTFEATITRNDPPTQILYVTNGGIDTLDDITVSEGASWLVTWIGGSGNNQCIMNRVDIAGLSVGTYNATVTVSCANATNTPQTYTVILNIDAHADPTPLDPRIIIWVATTGSDLTGTGSQVNPYRTIERALLDFRNGNQIRLLNGIYTPTDTVMISGLEGSIFAETPGGATIKPQQTSNYGAAIAITNSTRFTVQGVNIIQSDSSGHTYGIYANDVENFVAYTCSVSDFDCPSGCAGIWASGTGKIENCLIEDLSINAGDLYGIYSDGLYVLDNTVRRLTDRGNSSANGIYIIDNYTPPEPPVPPPPPPPPPDPKDCWWEFNAGTSDALRLDATGGAADAFDPQGNTNDFTVAGNFTPDTVSPMLQAVFTKGNVPAVANCWGIYLYYSSFVFGVSKDGTDSGAGVTTQVLGISAGVNYFFSGRYNYISDGGSYLECRLGATTNSINTAVGPVYSSENADVQIADVDHLVDAYLTGDIYWLAYWNRCLEDAEVDGLYAGTLMPWDTSGIVMYINYCKDVAVTYEPEICDGLEAPFIFTVEGSPIKQP